jgi:hypothetical protein
MEPSREDQMESSVLQGEGTTAQAADASGVERREVGELERQKGRGRAVGAPALGALAIGAFALGAFAVGALAVGRLAVGRLSVGKSRVRRLEIEELDVKRLRVGDVQISGTLSDSRDGRAEA